MNRRDEDRWIRHVIIIIKGNSKTSHQREEIIQLQETLFLRVYSVETTLKPWENPSVRFLAYPGEFDEMQFHLMQNKWFILILHNS